MEHSLNKRRGSILIIKWKMQITSQFYPVSECDLSLLDVIIGRGLERPKFIKVK